MAPRERKPPKKFEPWVPGDAALGSEKVAAVKRKKIQREKNHRFLEKKVKDEAERVAAELKEKAEKLAAKKARVAAARAARKAKNSQLPKKVPKSKCPK